jgi:hypothetical protein
MENAYNFIFSIFLKHFLSKALDCKLYGVVEYERKKKCLGVRSQSSTTVLLLNLTMGETKTAKKYQINYI